MIWLAALAVLAELLILNPSVDKQMKQLDDTAADSRKLTDHYIDKHQRDETNQKLNDIEDAIIFNGLEDSDDN